MSTEPEPPPTAPPPAEPGFLDQAGEFIGDTIDAAGDAAGTAIDAVQDFVTETVPEALGDAADWVNNNWGTVLDGADVFDATKDLVTGDGTLRKVLEESKEFGESLGESIVEGSNPC